MDRLNTIDPTVAKRWVEEFEKGKRDEMTLVGRHRNERRQMKDHLKSVADRAEAAGLNRQTFLDEIEDREIDRKREARKAAYSEEAQEQRELLKDALGGLPLGDWGVDQMPAKRGRPKKSAAAVPGAVADGMSLAEAKAILAQPRKRGKPSKERLEAERIVAEAMQTDIEEAVSRSEGASGAQAAAMADAMEAGGADALSSLVDEDNVVDLRPPFLRNRSSDDAA